jgi:hypothetical protein
MSSLISLHFRPFIFKQVCQWIATGGWFSLGTPVSSTNKIDRQDITGILLKVAIYTTNKSTIKHAVRRNSPTLKQKTKPWKWFIRVIETSISSVSQCQINNFYDTPYLKHYWLVWNHNWNIVESGDIHHKQINHQTCRTS